MEISEVIRSMIAEATRCPRPIAGQSNLCTDLGLDSLAYTGLLVRVEEAFGITFALAEMRECVQVDALISTVARRLREGGRDDA